ncbi:MAG: glycolate oxidase subunit GlcE [Betaproteobacteria bacterium TMED82]|nr:MAG: glycolate oxidase subunit GlcE [Betaproteobacteria bacterium TMED82]|tara:strand:- start:52482 stop:53669 length:1188 start_codon:yes stop_codon:yes gene_type:complete
MMTEEGSDSTWLANTKSIILEEKSKGGSVNIRGHGSKGFYGNPVNCASRKLSTKGYSGIVDYQPSELVVVAKSGTDLTTLENLLKKNNQFLNFEPPRLKNNLAGREGGALRGTVGGMVASGLSGPGRFFFGACRDSVLGVSMLNGEGEVLSFGGTVIKNVAGYDISRVQVGALGGLGLILTVSLRVFPRPRKECSLAVSVNYEEATEAISILKKLALPISATLMTNFSEDNLFKNDILYLRLSGSEYSVDDGLNKIREKFQNVCVLEELTAEKLWVSFRDQELNFFRQDLIDGQSIWRLSVPFGTKLQIFDKYPQIIEWGGALRWIKFDEDPVWVRTVIKKTGGHATLYRASDILKTEYGAFSPLSETLKNIHINLKKEMDPNNLFNRGRLYDFF